MTAENCAVSDDDCLNPAGYGTATGYGIEPPRTRVHCHYCGEAVCRACRVRRGGKWYCNTHTIEGTT